MPLSNCHRPLAYRFAARYLILIVDELSCCVFAVHVVYVGGRGRHSHHHQQQQQLSESCSRYRRHLRPAVSVHLHPLQRRLLADLLVDHHTATELVAKSPRAYRATLLRSEPDPAPRGTAPYGTARRTAPPCGTVLQYNTFNSESNVTATLNWLTWMARTYM